MDQDHRRQLPEWVWGLAFAASDASLQYDESMVPTGLMQAWERCDEDASQHQVVLDLLRTCRPRAAHYFLHCAGNCEELTAQFDVVLKRPDCDRATALMYFAWFWANYYEGSRPDWMDEEQHELMSYIRTRAWNGGYGIRKFDLAEGTLHELEDMREVLVDKDHPFSLPASFLALSKKEELFYKLREKFMPRRSFAN